MITKASHTPAGLFYVQDVRYFARSQGWRCDYVQDVRYFARSQGWRCDYVQDVRTEICSSVIAPALPYYRPSMDICNFCTSTIRPPWRRKCNRIVGTILAMWVGRYLLLQYLHFHHPWWSYFAKSQEGDAEVAINSNKSYA